MKIKKLISVIGLLAMLAAFTGCGLLSHNQRTIYNTLGSTEATATATVDGYYLSCAKGFSDTNGIPNVTAAYNKFQGVMQTAVAFAQNNTNALAPANVVQELSSVVSTVAMFSPRTVTPTP